MLDYKDGSKNWSAGSAGAHSQILPWYFTVLQVPSGATLGTAAVVLNSARSGSKTKQKIESVKICKIFKIFRIFSDLWVGFSRGSHGFLCNPCKWAFPSQAFCLVTCLDMRCRGRGDTAPANATSVTQHLPQGLEPDTWPAAFSLSTPPARVQCFPYNTISIQAPWSLLTAAALGSHF